MSALSSAELVESLYECFVACIMCFYHSGTLIHFSRYLGGIKNLFRLESR
jgi:hypothetical protein